MGVNSSKGFNFRLMASGSNGFQQLDTFSDEEILVSNNVTGLFDLDSEDKPVVQGCRSASVRYNSVLIIYLNKWHLN